ncbi:MAG: TolC family protein [Deltaproteobacteria bacterium]|nr:TolC family protein [Deltaproteobacteria bacterium]
MNRRLFLVTFLLTGLNASAGELKTVTLQDCYNKALKQSATLAIQEETIRIAEAHYLQALGTALPKINAKGTEFVQAAGSDSGALNTFTRRTRPEVAITLRQPLFQGLREFKALAVSGSEKKMNRLTVERARQLLFLDVAVAYTTLLNLEEDGKILQNMLSTLQSRNQEIDRRIRLGKSRESEKLASESQSLVLESELEKNRGQIKTAYEMLSFLTGERLMPEGQRLSDSPTPPVSLPSEEEALLSLHSRPDLAATEEGLKLARGKLSVERGAFLPTLDAQANYYPYRVGLYSDINWDLLFTLNFPIFDGTTWGRVKEAKAGFKQAELDKQDKFRRAEMEVRNSLNNWQTSRSHESALKKAAAKAEANYKAQAQDYQLGLVNNLEVLQSMKEWLERQREEAQARYQAKLDYLQFKITTGSLEAQQ